MIVRVAVALLVVMSFNPRVAGAQGSTGLASIAGVVKDATGAVMPGVTVEASSPALIEKTRSVVTDAQGQYKLVELPSGVYVATFSLAGFETVKRQGLELTANFTAPVNVEMRVGELEESVTVSGASPLVDVQNVVQQQVLTRSVLDTVPTNKSLLGFAAFVPAIIVPITAQDVGGSKGEFSVRMTVHGGKPGDQRLLQDGMNYNSLEPGGTGRGFFINPATASEFTLEQGAGNAEYSGGGVNIDLVPKSGGNRFEGYFFTSWTNHDLQANNLTPAIQAQGLTAVNGVDDVYDINAALGGPIVKNTLWFYTAHRHWGDTTRVANVYLDSAEGSPAYSPDLTRQARTIEYNQSDNLRLTWQVTPRNRVTISEDYQHNCSCQVGLASGGVAAEAVPQYIYSPNYLTQATWTFPASSKLLFEAGMTILRFTYPRNLQPGASVKGGQGTAVTFSDISILEQSTAFRFNSAASGYGDILSNSRNQRFGVTYTTGSHAFKVGLQLREGERSPINKVAGNVNYNFNKGVPVSIVEYATPVTLQERLKADLGLFVQDQWTVKRLTIIPGLRFDYLNSYNPEQPQPANQFVPARDFAPTSCLPCWSDLNPRLAAAFDLFGNGSTAVKASIGRYVQGETVGPADTYSPANTNISTTRTWKDSNLNLVPDCDLANPAGNGECGPLANTLFATGASTTTPNPAIFNGYGVRPYDWQFVASIQHQLKPGLAVFAGYYRTWYGNFTVTDNLAVTPANYDPYCITAPSDPRLPGGGGNQICGLYDLNPSKVGQVNNTVTFANLYGKQTEVYNGVDLNITAHFGKGGLLSGGANIGNSYFPASAATTGTSATNQCFVVDSPQQLYQCKVTPPYATRLKLQGSYPLPWDFQVSGSFQSLPGPTIAANYTVTSAQVASSLGRNLVNGTAAISLIQPASEFDPRINQLDLRLSKAFKVNSIRMRGILDAYNTFNHNTALVINTTYGPSWLNPTQIMDGRLFKLGFQIDF
jgi:Carboxypeptidase regulatory-like domain